MSPADIGIFIPFFAIMMGVGIPITAIKLRHRQKIEEMRLNAQYSQADSGRSAAQDSRIEMLEDRVQVLERIITDRGYDLATQIEALRDRSPAAELNRERVKDAR